MNPIPTEAADATPTHDVPIPLEFLDGDKIMSQVKGRYHEDPFFRMVMDAPDTYRNFHVTNEYIQLTTTDRFAICIPDILIEGHSARE